MTQKEKETVRVFVFEVTKGFQRLQNAETYEDIKLMMMELEASIENKKWSKNFGELIKKIDKDEDSN